MDFVFTFASSARFGEECMNASVPGQLLLAFSHFFDPIDRAICRSVRLTSFQDSVLASSVI